MSRINFHGPEDLRAIEILLFTKNHYVSFSFIPDAFLGTFEFEKFLGNLRSISSLIKADFLITKTYLYNFDPLKPHFYIVKLGFTVVYIIFRIFA